MSIRGAVLLVAALVLTIPTRAHATPCAPEAPPDAPLTMKAFATRLGARIDACAAEARGPDARRFLERHHLDETPERVRDYVVVRTLFELARDGGPWRLRWAVTNREPSAKDLWRAWVSAPPDDAGTGASATAECDELSALHAGLARRLGVRGVGLFWPTWNHTITAWEPAPKVRVLLPTTQIFQPCDATFDDTTFDGTVQKTVFEFPAGDVPDRFVVPAKLAVFLLDQVTQYAGASLDVLATLRIRRAIRLGSSVPASCDSGAAALRSRSLGPADVRALERYGSAELGLASPSAAAVLARL